MASAPSRGLRSAAFVSDVHLSEEQGATAECMSHFLRTVAQRAPDALYIVGDLFEYWAGDDDLGDPFNARIAAQLAQLARQGIALYFLPGNRDFLIGERFAQVAGLTLLADPTRLEVAGRSALVSHGDALCIDDTAYQAFRREVREPRWQQEFLARPLEERHALIGAMRGASESAKRNKPTNIMDVNADAVARLMREAQVDLLIHGHTHRPAHHRLMLDGHHADRWVLSDWDAGATPPRGAGLIWDEDGLRELEARA
jgi:UDP-2,3-diacylglucosamine hydrolase